MVKLWWYKILLNVKEIWSFDNENELIALGDLWPVQEVQLP